MSKKKQIVNPNFKNRFVPALVTVTSLMAGSGRYAYLETVNNGGWWLFDVDAFFWCIMAGFGLWSLTCAVVNHINNPD